MADWSQLPKELLILISKGLETRFDVIRFRSVCSTWRSSAPPKPRLLLTVRIPIPIPSSDYDNYCVIRRTIFLIGLPQSHVHWLVKIEEGENEKMKVLNPLSNSIIKPLPVNFPKVLDLLNFRVIELGHEYLLQCCKTYVSYDDYLGGEYPGMLCTNKVAFMCSSFDRDDDYTVFDLFTSMNIFKSQDKKWTIIKDKSYWGFDDVIHFNGKFYVLGRSGETLIVEDPSLNVTSLVHLGSRSSKKLLVESGGQLLMIDVYVNRRTWKSLGFPDEIAERLGSNAQNMMVWFDVFKLDEAGLKWDKVESLGDRLLFLGDYCTFSASASEFSGVEGNRIIFRDKFYRETLTFDGAFKESDMYVFSLENSTIRPLKDCPGYSKLFWPPPHWVISPEE